MTSYKSAHAFENMHASGLPGRPPLPKNAAPNFSIGSSSGNNNSHNNNNDTTHEGTPTTIGRKRSNSTTSTNFFGHQSYSHPHSIGQHSSQAAFSTSFVREQSLALGNLERRQSFDSEAIISPGNNSNSNSNNNNNNNNNSTSLSWASNTNSTSTPSGHQSNNHNVSNSDTAFGHRLPANSTNNIHNRKRDGADRSPPSGLSLLLKTKDQEDSKDKNPSSSRSNDTSATFGTGTGSPGRKHGSLSPPPAPIETKIGFNRSKHANGEVSFGGESSAPASETDRLLSRHPADQAQLTSSSQGYNTITPPANRPLDEQDEETLASVWNDFRSTKWTCKVVTQKFVYDPLGYIPAVILGLLLNLLDAISYGMIIFPLNVAPFQDLGPDGISMFFVSCIISQLVISLGGSAFKGGNGSMMIEVVPFLHIMAETVVARVGAENRDAVLATTILAYALSSLMTGAVFMALGYFKLGSLIAFFPRHILVGCIGGVGWFLIVTGFEISSRMTREFTYSWETFKFLFFDHHVFALWSTAFGAALILRALQHKIKHPFLVPTFFMVVPGIFYAVVWMFGLDWEMLRAQGWVFPLPEGHAPGWQFYSYFDLEKTNWGAILETVPAMLALTFFGILHVPINVPALGVSTGRDNVDTNRELIAHGWSNMISGGMGTVQNYLVYTNSLLFIKSGGDSRVAGIMLAAASVAIFLIGPWIVGYIPVMVVGSLIFHLGMDLVKEALWDTWGLVHHLEYLTITLIVIAMAAFGFVEGIFMGILLACVFFVVSNSRKEGVRFSCTGESAKSTVRRVYRQQKFLRQVGRQIYIFKLQGDMFFGTINQVEKEIQDVFSRRRWKDNPIQFLVLDFSLVRNVDFSAAEGFGRIRRAVQRYNVCLVLAGLDEEGEVGKALHMVGVWGAGAGAGLGEGHGHGHTATGEDKYPTQSFPGLSEALEYCENCLLESYYRTRESTLEMAKRKRLMEVANQDDSSDVLSPDSEATHFFSEHMENSPRKSHLFEAARKTLHANERPFPLPINLQQPVPSLLAAFHDTRENSVDFFLRLSMYFERRTVLAGTILWRQGGAPTDGIYLVEDGTLRSVQEFQDSGAIRRSVEVVLPGTISGELGLFTGNNRMSTVVSETDGILWGLSQERFQKMVKDDPTLAVEFMRVAMSYSAERLNTMTAYAFSLS